MAIFDLLVDMWRRNDKGWGFPYRPEIVLNQIECGTRPPVRKSEGSNEYTYDRTDPNSKNIGGIGVVDGPDGKLLGSVGVFSNPATWYTEAHAPVELWLYVRPGVRGSRRLERDLARFAEWVHETLRPRPDQDYRSPFPMLTGFMHKGSHFQGMARLWGWLFKGAKPCGMLFWRD